MVIFGSVLAAVIAVVLIAALDLSKEAENWAIWVLMCAVPLAALGTTLCCILKSRRLHPPPGAVTRRYAIKLYREGKKLFSDDRFLDVAFLNPRYAEEFIRLNESHRPKYKRDRLRRELEKLEFQSTNRE